MRQTSAAILASLFIFVSAAGAPSGRFPVPVRVHILTSAGKPVRNAYIALVPVWRPSSIPLVEEIAETGSTVFRVPLGKYQVIAGAKGFQISTEGFPVSHELGENRNVVLKPLSRVSGKVKDENGTPLAGARVAESRGEIVAPFAKLSTLAVRHLSSDWSVVTDQEGNWSLGVPDEKMSLVFSAAGRAAQWRLYKTGDPELDVSMFPGATLRVTCDRPDPNVMLTLEREGGDLAGSIPRGWQRPVWARWAKTPFTTWSSLPAGLYSVYAKYVDPRFFMGRATLVGKVELSAAKETELKVTLPSERHAAVRVFRLYLDGVSPQDVDVDDLQAFGLDVTGAVHSLHCVVQQTVGGTVLYVNPDGAKPPLYAVTADRFIGAVFDVADTEAEDSAVPPVPAALQPRADAYLVLRTLEKELQLPPAGLAVLQDCSKTIPRLSVPIRMRSGDLAEFTAPAGCGNAVLSFNPFEPVILTKPLRAGHQSVGEFVLRAAASADVRVVRDPGDAVVPGAIVRVMALSDDWSSRERIPAAEAETGADGWAHVEGLPVLRDLQFVAKAPGGESSLGAEARAEPHGRLTIDPLSIPKPATLVVVPKLSARVHELFPSARARIVSVEPVDPLRAALEKQQQKPTDEDSPLRFEPLKPGTWRATAYVEVAGTYALVKIAEVELKAGETRRLDSELEPAVFQGRVTSGGKGVAARITLDNRSVPDIARQHFDSKNDGTFYAVLPNTGTYGAVAVRLDSQSNDIPLGEIDFINPSQPMEIVLPATSTAVIHVRAGGKPVPKAPVWISQTRNGLGRIEHDGRGRSTDSEGDVKFEYVVAGEWVFSAHDERSGNGGEKLVVVREGEDSDVTLDIGPSNAIQGSVHDAAGVAVPNARIDCVVVGNTGTPSRSASATDADGKFTVDAYSELSAPALCSVIAPSGVVDAFKAMPGDAATVQLPSSTGALRISDWTKWNSPGAFWLAASDGRVISLSAVAEVASRFGPPLQIPALAAGRWQVIRLQSIPQWVALARGQGGALPTVAKVNLYAGATQSINVYDTAANPGGVH
ncbi:MAG: hypothetical protein QOK37_778 [Thermoanaerobaculia bacterium]|jgi:hypothetical protein|nr:hypothetical protein [Thermoanaerobaculia bacterium]